MNCLQNKSNCKTMCCKIMILTIPDGIKDNGTFFSVWNKSFADNNKKYMKVRGFKIVDDMGKFYIVKGRTTDKSKCKQINSMEYLVYCPCNKLDESTGKCRIHFRNKPKVCSSGYEESNSYMLWINECIFIHHMEEGSPCVSVKEIEGGEIENGEK